MIKHIFAIIIIFITTSCSTKQLQQDNLVQPYSQYLPNLSSGYYSTLYNLAKEKKHISIATTPLSSEAIIVIAEYNIQKRDYYKALSILSKINYDEIEATWQAYYFDQLFKIFKTMHKYDKALKCLITAYEINPLLKNQIFILNIWDFLYDLPTKELQKITESSTTKNEKGWAELAMLAKKSHINVSSWQEQYPDHTANYLINNNKQINKINNVAIILPISGPLKKAATAIKNGILSAYFATDDKPILKIYDSHTERIEDIFDKIKNTSDIIIGPLTKENIALLSSLNNKIPTIALNAIPEIKENLYELDLRVEDEALQMANFAFLQGKRKAFIATSTNNKSTRIFNALKDQWLKLGGEIIATTQTDSLKEAINEIQNSLLIQESKDRFEDLKNNIHYTKINFTPRRRQDIDSIFLAIDDTQAKNIAPLFGYFYTGNIPQYATSSIYNKKTKHDLRKIIQPTQPWRKDNSIPNKFFAIGLDAYKLTSNINKLLVIPRAYILGQTGLFYLDSQQHLKRKLLFSSN